MLHQNIINLLQNKSDQPYKSRAKNCVEISDDSGWTCNTNSQIKFKYPRLN